MQYDHADLVDKLYAKIDRLERENAYLRAKWTETSTIAMQGALAADRMKLELILNGCLRKPEAGQ